MRCAKWVARPVRHTEDFRVEFRFPPNLLISWLEVVARVVFGVKDWNGTLERLTTDSGYTHEHLANIPPNAFSISAAFILAGVVKRCLAGMVFPQKLIVVASGPTTWTLLAGVTSGTVVGVMLGFMCSPRVAAALVVLASTTYLLLLRSGKAQSTARRLAAVCYAVDTGDARAHHRADAALAEELARNLSRANALAPTLISPEASRLKTASSAEGGAVSNHDEFGVSFANGESVEVILFRFLHFTRFAPLDVGEKYIGPSAFAPWTDEEEQLIKDCAQQNDIGGGKFDWRVVEEEFWRRKVKPAGGDKISIRLRRSSGDLRRHYEEMKDRDLVRNITARVSSDLQSEYRRVLPSILRRPQHRNKAGIVMNPESLTVAQRETANKVQVAEWKARADALVTEVRGWREDEYMRERREEEGGTGGKYLKKIWERCIEGPLRDALAQELWLTYMVEREDHVPVSARTLGRTLTRNSPAGAVSWGEFLSFHIQSPAQLQQDHVDEIIKLPPVEQRVLIQKLLAVAVRKVREAEEVLAQAVTSSKHSGDDGRSLPAGHDRRIVNKIINNFDHLCMQALAPGETHRISTDDEEEEWLLVKPKGTASARPFYYEKNSNRKQWEKPLTGKTRYHQQLELLRKHKSANASAVGMHVTAGDDAQLGTSLDANEQSVQLHSLVKHAALLHRQDVDWALRLGGWMWTLAAVAAALLTPTHPKLMLFVALTMVWGSCNVALFPSSGPLTWLVHFLLAGSDVTIARDDADAEQ